jgi:hypothetical protein
MPLQIVYDVTGENYGHQPKGPLALYVTGSGGVPATPTQLAAHPEAVLIDQTPIAGHWDALADVDDYERGAVTLGELAPRAKQRLANFKAGVRPGQRSPLVYFSASDVHNVVNALIAGGVTSGVGLWVAQWSLTSPEAIAKVTTASGPFPIVAVQYHNAGLYDVSVFSGTWLANRAVTPVKPPFPKVQVGTVHSDTTKLSAHVRTTDGGHTWLFQKS